MSKHVDVTGEVVARSYAEAKRRVRAELRSDYPLYSVIVLSVEEKEGSHRDASQRACFSYYALMKERK